MQQDKNCRYISEGGEPLYRDERGAGRRTSFSRENRCVSCRDVNEAGRCDDDRIGGCDGNRIGRCGGNRASGCDGNRIGRCGGNRAGGCDDNRIGGCGGNRVSGCDDDGIGGCGGNRAGGCDSSYEFGCGCPEMVLAMAYVMEQPFVNLYEPDKALHRGTLFRDLDLPYGGTKRC